MQRKAKITDWEKFIHDFNQVSSFYRRGLLEIVIDTKSPKGYKELGQNPLQVNNSLLNFANRLYKTAFNAWQNKTIPQEYFSQVIKMMVCSFEIDEYFQISSDKHHFFQNFVDYFLQSSDSVQKNLQNKCEEICQRISPSPPIQQTEIFIEVAEGALLISLCGINTYYSVSDFASPREGLRQIEKLMEYIEHLASLKKVEAPHSTVNRGLGLLGLANYFKGRFLFSMGRYNEAEIAFNKSKDKYLEKMFWKTSSIGEIEAESRSLSLRRANLAQILGNTRIYLRQSRIKEALESLEKIRPFLPSATGKVMRRIADLIYVSAKRIKFSSDFTALTECKKLAEECYKDFECYIPNSYYLHRCSIEISLIDFFLKNFGDSVDLKLKLINESLRRLDMVVDYYLQTTKPILPKSRRLLVEALTDRSHIRREFPNSNQADYINNITLALTDAQRAVHLAVGTKQLESSAYIAYGLAHREKLLYLLMPEKRYKSDTSKVNEEFYINKQRAADHFFEAISLNNDKNPRIMAISYLRLAELELLLHPNYLMATFYFEKFEKYQNQIEHQYVLEFASKIKKMLLEKQVPDFYVDTSKSLNFKEWAESLKECLIKHTIYQKAVEIKGIMPAKRRRGEKGNISQSRSFDQNTRQTRQSILADAFKDKMGLAQNDAFYLANKHLKEFENFCSIISGTKNDIMGGLDFEFDKSKL